MFFFVTHTEIFYRKINKKRKNKILKYFIHTHIVTDYLETTSISSIRNCLPDWDSHPVFLLQTVNTLYMPKVRVHSGEKNDKYRPLPTLERSLALPAWQRKDVPTCICSKQFPFLWRQVCLNLWVSKNVWCRASTFNLRFVYGYHRQTPQKKKV